MAKLVYLYGIIPKNDSYKEKLSTMKGLDDFHEIHTIPFQETEAVICHLDEVQYGEKELEKKTNDVKWVHEKAFHHHEILMKLYEEFPIIPMKFCTIYSGEESLAKKLDAHQENMIELLEFIKDKEEWIMKIYCDPSKVRENVSEQNTTIDQKRKEIGEMSPGRQYLEKRKLDQLIDQEADREKDSFASNIHEALASISLQNEVKKNWNKDVTGRTEEMCWNSVYMLKNTAVDDFLNHVKELQDKWEPSGWQIEVTGPWPSYHYAKIG
ncbi:hypothetical protein CIL03_12235 [Virgibacillus indicus]|uniref:Gas vesicle protein GvpL n=1 Tax=Virgibacillus indicus TaxID=2024554 RepID=A0A265N8R8_9BACI|nr:GvpL/GvpF family gas vesicle protein [Virgibacillus indicus]OZU88408.1 hypothetical protein CIL03_12235 [Virgibacillus indicus]